MKFEKGDRVKFLSDTGGGKVAKIVDDNTVLVLIDDGFEIPVKKSEIILDEGFQEDGSSPERHHKEPRPKKVKKDFRVSRRPYARKEYRDQPGTMFRGQKPVEHCHKRH
ncbi:MAG: preprotein translocase subunit YajC [Bacteroidales bacterium]|nr:preprotein translocase subunit YajC [Bacteroidales bacterium]